MIKSVGLEMHWAPDILSALFIKGKSNMKSIEYWYNTLREAGRL